MATPVSTNAHQHQLPATPCRRTMSVTKFGVSLLKVVATIDSPASHQGTDRPEAKNSAVPLLALLPKNRAGAKQTANESPTITQSSHCKCMKHSPDRRPTCGVFGPYATIKPAKLPVWRPFVNITAYRRRTTRLTVFRASAPCSLSARVGCRTRAFVVLQSHPYYATCHQTTY